MNQIPDELINISTPYFLLREEIILSNLEILRSALPPETRIYYSIKTNYEPPVLRTLAAAGLGAEVSSGFELALARESGFPGSGIILDGPALSEPEIEAGLKNSVALFNLHSPDPAEKLSAISSRLGCAARVTIRVQTTSHPRSGFLPRFARRFGISPAVVPDFASRLSRLPGLELAGLSTHTGTALAHPRPFLKSVDILAGLGRELHRRGFSPDFLNLGGGLPAAGVKSLTPLDWLRIQLGLPLDPPEPGKPELSEFCRTISDKIAQTDPRAGFTFAIEPGRSLVSNAGVLVTRVVSAKNRWIFLDGGINLLPESPFFLSRRFHLAGRPKAKPEGAFHLAGPSLNAADVLGLAVPLPRPRPGDLLVVENAGAYSLSRANQFSRLRPPVYFLEKNGKIRTCRRAETIEDLHRIWQE